jgi:hypothetical protein
MATVIQSVVFPVSENLVLLSDGRCHCKLCDNMFNSVQSGRNHLRNIHYAQRVQCSICKSVRSNHMNFRSHMIRVHGVQGVRDVVGTYGKLMGTDY